MGRTRTRGRGAVWFVLLLALLGWATACGTPRGEEGAAADGGPASVEATGGGTMSSPTVPTSPTAASPGAVAGWTDVSVELDTGPEGDVGARVGPFGARVFYPAAGDGGRDAEVDRAGGPYPVIAFGHGYLGRVEYYAATLRYLAARGYLVIAPTSQGGVLPDHSEFADELRASLTWMVAQGNETGSPFSEAVDPGRLGLSGHSMGGGCALLAAARDSRIAAVSTLAAADTRPSSLDLLGDIDAPVQSIAGSDDAIAPPDRFQVPLYEAVPTPRQLVLIEGGSHCGFLDDPPPLCDEGSMPPVQQIELTRGLLRDWFDLYLEGEASLRGSVWEPAPDPRLTIVSDP